MTPIQRTLGLSATLVFVALTALSLLESAAWIGQPFPGFLVLENRVVASAGLAHWPGTADGAIYQHTVVAVDGEPLASADELRERVRFLPVGTPVVYRFDRGDRQIDRTIATRRFAFRDFGMLFGAYVMNGLLLGGTALTLGFLRGSHASLKATGPLLALGALWGLTAADLYGPYRLFRVHALSEVLLFPAAIQMALLFPSPIALVRRRPWLTWLPWAAALALAAVYQLGLHEPTSYVASHLLATGALGAALATLVASQLFRYLRAESADVRRQSGIFALAVVVALVLPVCLTIAEPLTGGRAPQNAVAFTAFLLPLSIAYAVLGSDLSQRRGRNGAAHGSA